MKYKIPQDIKCDLENILRRLEAKFDQDLLSIYFSGFESVVVHGHTSHPDDNYYVPQEKVEYALYRAGAIAAEKLLCELPKAHKLLKANKANHDKEGYSFAQLWEGVNADEILAKHQG